MTKPLPPGLIPLDEAVERIARHKHPELNVIYRDEGAEAFCWLFTLAGEGRIQPLIWPEDGILRKAYLPQFEGFKDKYWKFTSTPLRCPPMLGGCAFEVEREPSYDLLDESLKAHRNAPLVLRESELEGELASVSEPTGDNPEVTASPEKPSFDWVREPDKQPFPDSRMPELVDFLTNFHRKQAVSGGSCSENAAWEAARSNFSEHVITRTLVRAARRTAGCQGKPGKRLNRAEK